MSQWGRLLLAVLVLLGATAGLAKQVVAQVITEIPVPTANSYPRGIVTGPDGTLWFTEPAASKIGRITSSGAITEFPVGSIGQYYGWIAAGPDGALWFTESAANKIGRITTAGVLSEFSVPTSNSAPTGIALGSDGNMWFTEVSANNIGRITTAGVITEFPIPTGGSGAWLITAGPDDGALWFDEFYTNKIGRITTAGVFTEFTVPTPNSGPSGITTGPDGALWFCEQYGDKIGRITTGGVFSEFPIPTKGSNSEGIAVGPDGALWFAEAVPNGKIGRITTGGAVTEFALPAVGGLPFGVTSGPDGGLWFTDYANNIGRFAALQVSPATNIAPSGPQGGPFSPTSFSYQLASTTGTNNYSISAIPSWLNASFTSGTATTSPVTVTFSLINVGSLTAGTYAATIAFTNSDTGLGTQTRTATLTVNPPGLNVTPATGIAASGPQGGPFSPSSFNYMLNATSGSLNYSISNLPSWLSVSLSSGTVTMSPTTVTFKVNSRAADKLTPNTYVSSVSFNNTTNNQGNTTRVATLIVNPKEYTVTVRASPSADGTVTGGGTFVAGNSTTVTAVANSGHSFVHWTEGGKVVSTSPSYTFAMPSANVSLIADFH
jgi:virginiamycin B lyase